MPSSSTTNKNRTIATVKVLKTIPTDVVATKFDLDCKKLTSSFLSRHNEKVKGEGFVDIQVLPYTIKLGPEVVCV